VGSGDWENKRPSSGHEKNHQGPSVLGIGKDVLNSLNVMKSEDSWPVHSLPRATGQYDKSDVVKQKDIIVKMNLDKLCN
jgi:hypothetical protein